ncbi:MAG: hypothetical protein ACK559_22780, partial [bacterium]
PILDHHLGRHRRMRVAEVDRGHVVADAGRSRRPEHDVGGSDDPARRGRGLPVGLGEGVGLGDQRADQRRQQIHTTRCRDGDRVGRVASGGQHRHGAGRIARLATHRRDRRRDGAEHVHAQPLTGDRLAAAGGDFRRQLGVVRDGDELDLDVRVRG